MQIAKLSVFLVFVLHACIACARKNPQDVINQLRLPAGFSISVYADNVPQARSLALGDNGVLFVGTGSDGKVYAVRDQDGDGVAESRYVIAKGLYMPNGVAFRNGSLYVAEVNRILRFDRIIQQLDDPPKPAVVFDKLPSDKHHGWKYLRFGPDNKLYFGVGAPCNICRPEKPASMRRRVSPVSR